jgi:MFS family permease
LRTWLGLERNILVMLGSLLILGMGEELWLRFVPKYLELLGATAWGIAVYGMLQDVLDAVYPYPGGWLADRLGRRRALLVFTVLAMVGYGLYLFGPSWQWVLVGTVFVMAWSSLTLPAIFAIIGDHLPPARRAIGFGVQSIWKRVPRILAPPLGGWLILHYGLGTGVRLGLGITLVLAFLSLLFIRRYYVEAVTPQTESTHFRAIWRGMDSRLKRLLVADCLARWAEGIPRVFIILYFLDILGGDTAEFGWLISLQMIAATVLYLPVAKLSDRLNRKPFVLLTFTFFALFPLVLVSVPGWPGVVLAFVIAGLREIGEPARKSLIVDLASHTARGRVIGMYYLVRGLVVFPAALVGGWLWVLDPQLPFHVAFMVGVLGLLVYAFWVPGDR